MTIVFDQTTRQFWIKMIFYCWKLNSKEKLIFYQLECTLHSFLKTQKSRSEMNFNFSKQKKFIYQYYYYYNFFSHHELLSCCECQPVPGSALDSVCN